jgi:transcriptional regulator with XRE-family HTH domain
MIKEIDNAKVKERLIELKLKSNLKSEEISQQANVAIGTVNDHFNKNKPAKDIKSDILYKYSRLFGVTVDYLLCGENETEFFKDEASPLDKCFDMILLCLNTFGDEYLKITEEFKTDIYNVYNYAPFDYYTGTYNNGDTAVELKNVFSASSTIQMNVKSISDVGEEKSTITLEIISSIDQEIGINLDCWQSGDNLGSGDNKKVNLKASVPETVQLSFGGVG